MGLTATQKAGQAGVEIRRATDYRTPCPQCSPNRKKKKDQCLHVTIKNDAVLVNCHHCGWGEGYFNDAGGAGKAWTGRRAVQPSRPRRWW
ncbi:hypothetical protein BDI01nite_33710 [Brevundimonas diminuta]|nr:hypothetical protein BDI01nite_33710 [Brevundimonas diminuta]